MSRFAELASARRIGTWVASDISFIHTIRDMELTLFFFGLSLLGCVGRAADLNDSFLSISDLVGGAAAGGGTPPVGL